VDDAWEEFRKGLQDWKRFYDILPVKPEFDRKRGGVGGTFEIIPLPWTEEKGTFTGKLYPGGGWIGSRGNLEKWGGVFPRNLPNQLDDFFSGPYKPGVEFEFPFGDGKGKAWIRIVPGVPGYPPSVEGGIDATPWR
jgi:hypothetical protein